VLEPAESLPPLRFDDGADDEGAEDEGTKSEAAG
jgi:hypothetical protein